MSKKILILGGRPIGLKEKKILDTFDKICRININMKYKNPTKKDIFYVNNHVNSLIVKERLAPQKLKQSSYNFVDLKVLTDYHNMLNNKEYSEIIEQYESGDCKKSNIILKNINCPYKFQKAPRCGYQAILYFLQKGYKVSIIGFSVQDDNICTYYNDRNIKGTSLCHDHSNEIKILNWLITNGFIKKASI